MDVIVTIFCFKRFETFFKFLHKIGEAFMFSLHFIHFGQEFFLAVAILQDAGFLCVLQHDIFGA